MAVKQLTQEQIDFLNQFLEFDGTDPITAINLYQIFDSTHPELNQITANELQKMWTDINARLGSTKPADATRIDYYRPVKNVQILNGVHSDNVFGIKPITKSDFKHVISKDFARKDMPKLPGLNNIRFDANLNYAVMSDRDVVNNLKNQHEFLSDPDDDNDPMIQFAVYPFDRSINQLVDDVHFKFTGHFNDLASGKFLADFVKLLRQIENFDQEHHYEYFSYVKLSNEPSWNDVNNPKDFIDYLTGIPITFRQSASSQDTQLYQLKNKSGDVLYTITSSEIKNLSHINKLSFAYNRKPLTQLLYKKLIRPYLTYNIVKDVSINDRSDNDVIINLFKKSLKPGYQLVKVDNGDRSFKENFANLIKGYQISSNDQQLLTNWINQKPKQDHVLDHFVMLDFNADATKTFFIDDPQFVKEIAALSILSIYRTAIKTNGVNRDLAKSIAKMIYVQQDRFNPQFIKAQIQGDASQSFKDQLKQFNTSMQKFLMELRIDNSQIDHNSSYSISLKAIIDYIHAVKHHEPITAQMLGLITSMQDDNDYDSDNHQPTSKTDSENQKIITNEAANAHLFDKLELISDYSSIKAIQKLDKPVRKRIINVYQIDSTQQINFPHYKTLCHGTGNYSLLSILKSGLLTSKELQDQNNQKWNYTGSGLGVGAYFARLDQAQKAANYTDCGNMNHYIFIAKVGYNSIYDVDHYDSDATERSDDDLIWAHATGSFGRDELVAKSSNQIQLQYLIELKNE